MNLFSFWAIGGPGYALCFKAGLGVFGLWWGCRSAWACWRSSTLSCGTASTGTRRRPGSRRASDAAARWRRDQGRWHRRPRPPSAGTRPRRPRRRVATWGRPRRRAARRPAATPGAVRTHSKGTRITLALTRTQTLTHYTHTYTHTRCAHVYVHVRMHMIRIYLPP